MIQAPRIDPSARESGRLILQRRLVVGGDVALGLPVERHPVAVGVGELERRTRAHLAVDPASAESGLVDRGDATLQCVLARRAEGRAADACGIRGGQLDRVELVVVPAAQKHGVALFGDHAHREKLREERAALLELRGEQLDAAEVGDVEAVYSAMTLSFLWRCSAARSGEDDAVEDLAGGADDVEVARHDPSSPRSTRTRAGYAPLGCSISVGPDSGSAARSAPTAPGMRMPAATDAAMSTPIEVCTRAGMKARVQIAPPSAAGDSRNILGTVGSRDVAEAHQLSGRRRRRCTEPRRGRARLSSAGLS